MNDRPLHIQIKDILQKATGLPWEVRFKNFAADQDSPEWTEFTFDTYVPRSIVESPFNVGAVKEATNRLDLSMSVSDSEQYPGKRMGFFVIDSKLNNTLLTLQDPDAQEVLKDALLATRAIVLLEKVTDTEWHITKTIDDKLYASTKTPVPRSSVALLMIQSFIAGALASQGDPRVTEIQPRVVDGKLFFPMECLRVEPVLSALQFLLEHPQFAGISSYGKPTRPGGIV